MSSYNVMTSIHVWVGTAASAAHLEEYFRIDPASRDAGHGASQFDRDVGINWYDDDLIGVFFSATPGLETCLDELPTSPETVAAVRVACLAAGISAPNALFYYTDADLTIASPTRLFGGLHYVGAFDNS